MQRQGGGGSSTCFAQRTCFSHGKDDPDRNVPDALHRKPKARAAHAGMSLSDFLRAEIERLAALPTREEMLKRLHGRPRVRLRESAAMVVRRERDSA